VQRKREEAPMRVLIADNQSRVRFALRALLARQPGLELVGEANCAPALLEQARVARPDLLVLGWELIECASTLAALRQTCPGLRVIALSGRAEARQAALEAGADVFVSKTQPPEQLLAAISICQNQRRELT
jgi:DNA-binding NarL/FixJ family response regulator